MKVNCPLDRHCSIKADSPPTTSLRSDGGCTPIIVGERRVPPSSSPHSPFRNRNHTSDESGSMMELAVVTRTGQEGRLALAAVDAFRKKLRGPVLCAGDQGYEEARQVWNGLIDRRP